MLNYPLKNIANIGNKIYLFNRQKDGSLTIMQDTIFKPYFYEEDPKGIYQTIDGKKVSKITCREPGEIKRRKTDTSYEADVIYPKRYMIDKVSEILPSPTKYLFIDIEIQTKELPSYLNPDKTITSISIYNSLEKTIRNWFIKDYLEDLIFEKLDYKQDKLEMAEDDLLKNAIRYIKDTQPDLILGWNFVQFDYPYLAARIKRLWNLELAELISPISKMRYGRKEDEIPYPTGISILDYLDLFKKIYKGEVSYALDSIAHKYLNTPLNKKADFSQITEEIKEKNIEDIKKMVGIEKEKKIIPYYDEIRRMGKCLWEDIVWNSKVLDMMLLSEAKSKGIVLPSKHYGEDFIEEIEFEGAYRKCDTGRFENLYKLDLGCYSEDTEILSIDGWKKYNELQEKEELATFSVERNLIEFQQMLYLNIKKVKILEMYSLENSKTKQLLTWNHKVLYKYTVNNNHKKAKKDSWQIAFAKDFHTYHTILPLSANFKRNKDYPISDELLKIHAWIITEGHNELGNSRVKSNIYHISQSSKANPVFCKEIDLLFKQLKWNVSKYDRKGIRKGELDWNLKWLYSTYIQLEDNYKVIPLWMLKELSTRQLNILFKELMKGDGDKNKNNYNAKDKLARDRFQYLLVLLGYSTQEDGRKNVYFNNEHYTNLYSPQKKKVLYSGIVWCPTVKNGFVIMRRKGKVFISGNSAYPMAIIDFCLDIANLTINKNELKIDITDRETNEVKYPVYFKQNSNALLPTLARKLIIKKDYLKKQLKSLDPETPEAKDLQMKYDAVKALVNSLFGVTALKVFRLYNVNIASAITSIVRDLLHYIEIELGKRSVKVIYLDTDSVMVIAKENPLELCNQLVQQWAKEKYNKEKTGIEFDYEGKYEQILIVALCHYKGRLRTKDNKLKIEVKGIEAKRKDSSKFMQEFQTKLIDKILDNESQEAIVEFIVSQKEAIKTVSITEIGFPCKISNTTVYKSPPIFTRALEYSKELCGFNKVAGDTFYYLYVEPFGKAIRRATRSMKNKDTGEKEEKSSEKEIDKNVLAYNEEQFDHVKNINWKKMIDKTIIGKCENIFEALGWDLGLIKEIKVKKTKKQDNLTEKEINEELKRRGLI